MKLRNKKTGEIVEISMLSITRHEKDVPCSGPFYGADSLAELNEEWEDYEEKKDFWFIAVDGTVLFHKIGDGLDEIEKGCIDFGNYFETKEEAEKAVEKLKAWKRLEKCNFRFKGYDDKDRGTCGDIIIFAHVYTNGNLIDEAQPSMLNDLDLLFGGEE